MRIRNSNLPGVRHHLKPPLSLRTRRLQPQPHRSPHSGGRAVLRNATVLPRPELKGRASLWGHPPRGLSQRGLQPDPSWTTSPNVAMTTTRSLGMQDLSCPSHLLYTIRPCVTSIGVFSLCHPLWDKRLSNAVWFVASFLSDPHDHKAADLALLQALIIELGFFNPSNRSDSRSDSGRLTPSFELSDIPQSMRAARAFIKSHVFVNVRDYLALRAQGQEALQNVLHPSRKSLVAELRKKDARVPRGWVKQRGLNVLLVTCF